MIMKTLSNNRGISLIILVIAMTLIAVLGASFVSLVGSKHKSSLYQLDSYRALNLANAGVEYAIRYISDELSNASSTTNYFRDLPENLVNKNFAGGTFSIKRNFSYTASGDSIEVNAAYPSSSPISNRKVKLTSFRRYLSALTLVADPTIVLSQRAPKVNPIENKQIVIPLLNNHYTNITVTEITVAIDFSTGLNPMVLDTIHLNGIQVYFGSSFNFSAASPSHKININDSNIGRTDSSSAIPTFTLVFHDPISETHKYTVTFAITGLKESVISFTAGP